MIIAFVPPAISCDSSSRPDSPASRECDPVKEKNKLDKIIIVSAIQDITMAELALSL